MNRSPKPLSQGFTLVELLVVIAIIGLLALVGVVGMSRFIENGRKVQTLALIRDFQVGMALFENDYTKPPIPKSKRDTGWDTIYGDPNGFYSNQYLVSALAGDDKEFPFKDENFSSKEANPKQESYITFKYTTEKKGGVGKDGKLYDPWGAELIVVINGFKSTNPGDTLVDFNTSESGKNDRRLYTWKLAEYKETKPREQSYVFWSYGKDKKKGNKGATVGSIVSYRGSDDVISW